MELGLVFDRSRENGCFALMIDGHPVEPVVPVGIELSLNFYLVFHVHLHFSHVSMKKYTSDKETSSHENVILQ